MAPDHEVVELAFTTEATEYPFVGLSARENCRLDLVEMLPRSDDRYAEYFSVTGADPERVLDRLREEYALEASELTAQEDGGLLEFVVSSGCPARYLAELGAVPHEVVGDHGEGRIAADVPGHQDPPAIIESFLSSFPAADLRTKRRKDASTPILTTRELSRELERRLSPRQQEVLEAAFDAGYYERPREASGEELADGLGISSATFSQHIRAAERSVLSLLYEDDCLASDTKG
ncbi:MAG: bacterio-opsin activator domain-containing protein [Haloarculaceae archaeon]